MMNACLVEEEVYLNNKCYLVTGENLFTLLLVFNSTIFNDVILQGANVTGGKGSAFLSEIRVPKPTKEQAETARSFCELLRNCDENELENILVKVDQFVYGLYGLEESKAY